METLTDNGYQSVAYDLLLQTEAPSWIYEVKRGATTVWESWFGGREGKEPRASHNHYSLGAVAGWIMSHALGITVRDGNITIRPYPDERLGYARGSYLSPLGRIYSSWEYTEKDIIFTFTVPANTEATVILPDGRSEKVCTGKHIYKIEK
jgi:alpha-L-rhamnosidase